jgi:hypothetical protein
LTCDFAKENGRRKITVRIKAIKSVPSPAGSLELFDVAQGRAADRFAAG